MKKGSKLYSIFRFKCPHCHEGDFYDGLFIKADVKEKCDVCGEKFSKEPGFYQGSYYVAYALGVAVFVMLWAATAILAPDHVFDTGLWVVIIGSMVLVPFTYPLSKIVWANLFFKYSGTSKNKQSA